MVEAQAKLDKGQTVDACSIRRALELLGDTPTLLIIEAYWLGYRRFTEFVQQTGLLRTVVNSRLQTLVATDCLEKQAYSSKPLRYEYRGTDKLHAVYPVALCMLDWERKWANDPDKLKVTLTCGHCQKESQPKPLCRSCLSDIHSDEVDWLPGPGSGPTQENYRRRRRATSDRADQYHTRLFDEIAGIIGDRWSVLILKSLFNGNHTFLALQNATNVASNILSVRLRSLIALGLLKKTDSGGNRSSYQLCAKGEDLYPILLTLMAWGDQWCSPQGLQPIKPVHQNCGKTLETVLVCPNCKNVTGHRDIRFSTED